MKVRPRIGRSLLAVGGLVAILPAVSAATNLVADGPTFDRAIDPMTSVLRVIGALLLVIAILVGGALYFRKTKFFAQYKGAARLRVLETRSLGFRSNLLVVGYEQNRYLLSVSPTGVQMLTALPQDSKAGGSFEETLKSAEESRPR